MVFPDVLYQFFAASERCGKVPVRFLYSPFVYDAEVCVLLLQCVPESLYGTRSHETVFHQCDVQTCNVRFGRMRFQPCSDSFQNDIPVLYQQLRQGACVGFSSCALGLSLLQAVRILRFGFFNILFILNRPFHEVVFLNGFLLLSESHPVFFGSHAAADALLDDEPDHVGDKPFV